MLEHNDSKILLDFGLPISKIKKYLDFDLDLDGCLLSHYHMDHAKGAKELMLAAIDIYCSKETAEFLGLKGHRLNIVDKDGWFKIGPWNVSAIPTDHDTDGSYAYLIDIGGNRILFATDTGSFRYKIPGLTHIMIEANYSEKTATSNFMRRIRKTHMSLNNVLEFLSLNDLSLVREIRLIHPSERNADSEYFKNEIKKITGKIVTIN